MVQDFKNGKVDTAFIPKHEDELSTVSPAAIPCAPPTASVLPQHRTCRPMPEKGAWIAAP